MCVHANILQIHKDLGPLAIDALKIYCHLKVANKNLKNIRLMKRKASTCPYLSQAYIYTRAPEIKNQNGSMVSGKPNTSHQAALHTDL